MNFEITPEQYTRVQQWLKDEVYPPIIAKQRAGDGNPQQWMIDCWDDGYPYEGAIGGGVTYEFTPNSIGCTTRAVAYGQTLDLTDYESW